MTDRETSNLGGEMAAAVEPWFGGPDTAEQKTSIVLVERLLLTLLRGEFDRLTADKDLARRFFFPFFGPTAPEGELDAFLTSFHRSPPTVALGYPRMDGRFPAINITLESESPEEEVLSHFVGETLEDEDANSASHFLGLIMEQSFRVSVFAEHPDVTLYLYHACKMILLGGIKALITSGLNDVSFSGSELAPGEMYLPDSMFVRTLSVTTSSTISVPAQYAHRDGRSTRVGGIYHEDVTVDGVQGGVRPDGE